MKKYDIPGNPSKNYEDLLKLECDVVSACVPNFLHKDITTRVLSSGKHVLVEKPITKTLEEADDRERENNGGDYSGGSKVGETHRWKIMLTTALRAVLQRVVEKCERSHRFHNGHSAG